MNTSYVLRNETLTPSFNYVKVVGVHTEEDGHERPSVMLRLRIVPITINPIENQNREIFAVIQSTPSAKKIYDTFRSSFDVIEKPEEALGRFGIIGIYLKEYNGAKFGQVHFIKRNILHKSIIESLIKDEKNIPWNVDNKIIPKDNRKGVM